MTEDLIVQLCQIVVEKLRENPQADQAQLVASLQSAIIQDPQLEAAFHSSAGRQLAQIVRDDAQAFQTLVQGGIANIGTHYHVDVETLKQVLLNLAQKKQPIGAPTNLPLSGVIQFIGREAELEQIHQQLQQRDQIAIVAIAGMGGVGKTELAIQYAKAYRKAYPGGICWIFAREMNVGAQIVTYALVQLGLRVPDGIELADQVAFCWRNWPAGDVLVVLDDVADYRNVKPYLPPQNPRFKVLFTTRLKFGSPIQAIPVGVLIPEQSIELLTVLIGQERVLAEGEIARSLCEWLGHLPLALELVGRYINLIDDLSLAEMLFRLQQKAKNRQALTDQALVRDDDDPIWTLTAQRGVEAAFELSWDVLDQQSQHLGKLLSLFSLAPISWHLVEAVKQQHCQLYPEHGEFQPEQLKIDRSKLLRFHLLQRVEQQTYRLHALIREFFRSKLDDREVDIQTNENRRSW